MADDIKKIDVEAEEVKPTPKGKKFMVLTTKRIGSKKDGSPKEHYVKGTEIKVSGKKKIERLKSLNII